MFITHLQYIYYLTNISNLGLTHNFILIKMENEEVIKQIENSMTPRFGHTITLGKSFIYLVHKSKAVLFGGATGIEGKFAINSDTYVYYVESKQWVKLDRI